MEDKSKPQTSGDSDTPKKSLADLDRADDGRNKEWEDRARVNLEEVPEGTRTSIERDFEPENPRGEQKKQDDNDVY